MNKPILSVKGLHKSYGNFKALKGITYELYENEILGVLGPNGAGKTTGINCLCGILPYDKGEVLYSGESNGFNKGLLGLCPQELIIWKKLSLFEQLKYMGELYKVPKRSISKQADHLLQELGLMEKKHVMAESLSGGMKRRLNIALSLMHDPEVLILDEPEAGLDPQSRILVRDFIKRESEKRSIILTTHNMDEARKLSSRLILIDHGKIIEEGIPEEIIKKHNCKDLEEVFIELTGRSLRD